MLNRLKTFFEEEIALKKNEVILLAVSGGRDSMALWHACRELEIPHAIVHCNFQLRGKDSADDENFVKEIAAKWNTPCFVRKFDTIGEKAKSGEGTQQVARRLRYAYFQELMQAHSFSYLATAHHAQDALENFFIYLQRNQMAKAWNGIRPINENVIRPMICVTPGELTLYVSGQNILWREDISNASDNYLRNRIRHYLLEPLMSELDSFCSEFSQISADFRELEKWENANFRHWQKNNIEMKENGWKLRRQTNIHFLKKFLYNKGFTKSAIQNMVDAKIGSSFILSTGLLHAERDSFVFKNEANAASLSGVILKEEDSVVFGNMRITTRIVGAAPNKLQLDNASQYIFDAEKVPFPLNIRVKETGDRIAVFGSGKHKKLSDIFINNKIENREKKIWPILFCGVEILCVPGLQRSNLAPVQENTKRTLIIDFEQIDKSNNLEY